MCTTHGCRSRPGAFGVGHYTGSSLAVIPRAPRFSRTVPQPPQSKPGPLRHRSNPSPQDHSHCPHFPPRRSSLHPAAEQDTDAVHKQVVHQRPEGLRPLLGSHIGSRGEASLALPAVTPTAVQHDQVAGIGAVTPPGTGPVGVRDGRGPEVHDSPFGFWSKPMIKGLSFLARPGTNVNEFETVPSAFIRA